MPPSPSPAPSVAHLVLQLSAQLQLLVGLQRGRQEAHLVRQQLLQRLNHALRGRHTPRKVALAEQY